METAYHPPQPLVRQQGSDLTAVTPVAPLRMIFVDGIGMLALDRYPLGALATMQRLEVTIPELRLPAELTAAAAHFRNRRGRFRSATLSIRPAQMAGNLAERALAAAGLSNVAVHIDAAGSLRLAGRARLAGREADFTGRVDLRRVGQRRLHIGVEELHLFGYLPVPAPIVAGALLSAILPAPAPARTDAGAGTTIRWQATVDVLELALLEIFVASGWRLPDLSAAALETIAVSSEQIILVFGEAPLPATKNGADTDADAALIGNPRLHEAEGLLARGDYQAALACLRQVGDGAADPRITERTLQVLLAGTTTQSDAEALAARILAEDGSSIPALLAQASVAAERDNPRRAADLFLTVAALADAQGRADDAAFARAAASTQRAAADQLVIASGPAAMPPSAHVTSVALAVPRSPSQRLAPPAETRRMLAEIALSRQDLGGGALLLEEALSLLPPDALDQLLDVRQSLGSVYVRLQDWSSARYYLELVLAQDPHHVMALEMLVGTYLQLGLANEATATCERLARLYQEPSKRARILYRQGEILRAAGADEAAFEAFLRASDVDPYFAPTMIRLVDYFWREGDFQALAEVAADLVKAGALNANPDPAFGARIVISTALAGVQLPAAAHPQVTAWDPALAAKALAEACDQLGAQTIDALDLALAALIAWGGAAVEPALMPALAALVEADPSRPGPVRALGRIADRRGNPTLARALYAVLVFADADDPTAERLHQLGPAPAATPEALQAIGPTVHRDGAGPLRAHTANRIGLLACGSLLDALKALAAGDPLIAAATSEDSQRQARRAFLRTTASRELVRYVLSDEYERALAAP